MISRKGYLGATSGTPKQDDALTHSISNGTYIPDEENMELCLNCTRKSCTGNCKKIMEAKKRRAEERRHA
jgi:hypothetical protein